MEERVYTEQQMKIILLENNQSHCFKSIDRIDVNINNLSNKIDTFKYWVISLIFGLYAVILAAIISMIPFLNQISNISNILQIGK